MKDAENSAPEIFTTYERLEVCHRVEVTDENMHVLARHFGWRVDYGFEAGPRLVKPTGHDMLRVGDWIDHRGSRWNPEPLTQGWSTSGTYLENRSNDA
ncbi:hypothetical protein [Microbacterium allomyrinae]|uniref:Uncharacterized protein n=1 Tax=Microbacterium allomyrinae TaxID=2830666 RepID=A0A9X1LWT5_9MICO|nr:hypothetical protein [Microbacterium allomyrinae]MCC2033083.1 hypothetical protein [Microbacterium allomyrinae]